MELRKLAAKINKRLDTFTDDFNPPGPVESTPGQDRSKPGQTEGYGKPHDDTVPRAEPGCTLAAAKCEDCGDRAKEYCNKCHVPLCDACAKEYHEGHSIKKMAAAGNARDQEALDWQDELMQIQQAGIKKPADQFPGKPSVAMRVERRLSASDNATYDKHQTDPARLSAGMIHREEYKGREIHVMESGPSYAMAIDRVKQPGNFPGVATAVQRGRILIDRSAV